MARLTGLFPLSYRGVNAVSPPNFIYETRAPNPTDSKNFYIGDIWLQRDTTVIPTLYQPWMLVDLRQGVATWIPFGGGGVAGLLSLTGDTGGAVFGDVNDNINLLSGIVGLTIDGNPGTNTLFINNTGGNPLFQFLEGDTGGPVPPDAAGIINIESGILNFSFDGNPGTNTITLNSTGGGPVLETLTGDIGGAVQPDANGNIDILTNVSAINAGATILFEGNPAGNEVTLNVTDSLNNTLIGENCGNAAITGNDNTGFGSNVLDVLSTGLFNTCVGSIAGNLITTGSDNTAIGQSSLSQLVSGNNNIAIGQSAGLNYTNSETNNILIGNGGVTGENNITRLGNSTQTNVIIESQFLDMVDPNGSQDPTTVQFLRFSSNIGQDNRLFFFLNNVFLGQRAGNTTMTPTVALFNIGIGPFALDALTTGAQNCAYGNDSLGSLTTGQNNLAMGFVSGQVLTTGSGNVAIGSTTLADGVGGGVTTGSNNIVMGNIAGSSLTGSDSNNIIIGALIPGTSGDNNTCRIGLSTGAGAGQLNRTFIAGIRGIAVVGGQTVLVDANNQLGSVVSSIRYKENVQDLDNDSEIIYDLRPVKFNYKEHPDVPAWGLIAEEVDRVFPNLVIYNEDKQPESVKYHDLPVLLLNELQKQREIIQGLMEDNQDLHDKYLELRDLVDDMTH